MAGFFSIFERIFSRVTFYLAVLAAVAIVLTMFTLMVDTAARWAKISILGIFEFNALLVGMCIYLGVAFTQSEKRHISVKLLTGYLPKRVAAIFDIPILLICLAVVGWTSYLYYQAARYAFVKGEIAQGISQFPLFPIKLIMFLGVVLLTVQLVIDITIRVREVYRATSGGGTV